MFKLVIMFCLFLCFSAGRFSHALDAQMLRNMSDTRPDTRLFLGGRGHALLIEMGLHSGLR